MEKIDLSVVIPTLNSSRFIAQNIKTLKEYLSRCRLIRTFEIIVVAQTSDDDTFDVLKKIKSNMIIPLFLKERGKGNALTKGIRITKYPVIMIVDDDLPYSLTFVDKAIRDLYTFDLIIASRYVKRMKHDIPLSRKVASFVYRSMIRFLFHIPQKDIQAGLKIMKKSIFDEIPLPKEKRFVWDTELLYYANKRGLKIKEISLSLIQKPNFLRLNKVVLRILADVIRLRLRTL
jgi:glycosyltransferase involved in cell wall biosynthesis